MGDTMGPFVTAEGRPFPAYDPERPWNSAFASLISSDQNNFWNEEFRESRRVGGGGLHGRLF